MTFHAVLVTRLTCSAVSQDLQRLLALLRSAQVTGRKRARLESSEDTAALLDLQMDGDEQPRKKTRTGWADSQWIMIFNQRKPMKQRCAPGNIASPDQRAVAANKGSGRGQRLFSVTCVG
jgi:hypothetical protein